MRCLRLFALAIACVWLGSAAWAQDFPSRNITFVVNYPPGGAVDITARLVGEKLSKIVQRSVVIENRPGGTGSIGAASVARAEADGHTILVTANPVISFLPVLGQTTQDPIKDLLPIAKVAVAPTVLVVPSSSPHRSLSDLVEEARRPENKILVGVTGVDSSPDIELKLLNRLAHTRIETVPYNGTAPVMNDVLGGHITAGAAGLPAVMSHITEGKMRGLVVISPVRSSILRDVPTVTEALGVQLDGFPTWYGFFAPPGTPSQIVEFLEAGILQVMRDPAVHEKMRQLGYEVAPTGSRAFGEENLAEIDRLRRSVKAN